MGLAPRVSPVDEYVGGGITTADAVDARTVTPVVYPYAPAPHISRITRSSAIRRFKIRLTRSLTFTGAPTLAIVRTIRSRRAVP